MAAAKELYPSRDQIVTAKYLEITGVFEGAVGDTFPLNGDLLTAWHGTVTHTDDALFAPVRAVHSVKLKHDAKGISRIKVIFRGNRYYVGT